MWTPTTRAQHSRAGLRYGSDVTDAEWLILSPFLPAARSCGCPRKWEMREIVSAIFYVLRGGIAWSLLPKDFPPTSTVYRWFARFRDDGTWERINHYLVMLDRERAGREASPTAAVIDSQSVKTTESGGIRGFDAGKKIKGRKLAHGFIADDDAACRQQLVHHPQAQRKSKVEPHSMADDLSREAVAGVARASGCRHPARLPGSTTSRKPPGSQVDGAL